MTSSAQKARENVGAYVKSTVLVAVALTVAILLAVSFVIAAGVRGEGALLSHDPVTTIRGK